MKKSFFAILLLLLMLLPMQVLAADVPADGDYMIDAALSGGTGRASVESPAELVVTDGQMQAVVVWSSPNYTYMLIDGVRYDAINTEGNSTFQIPVSALDTDIELSAETIAMSEPHMIDYTLRFDAGTLKPRGTGTQPPVVAIVLIIVAVVAVLCIVAMVRKKSKQRVA